MSVSGAALLLCPPRATDEGPAPAPRRAAQDGGRGTAARPRRYGRSMGIDAVVWDIDDTIFDYTAA
ncbi:hypothetical protein ACFWER_26395, partial [Streptomyces sp. NPDC060188]